MRYFIFLLACCAAVNAAPRSQQRIVGGWATSIAIYPEVASLLYSYTDSGHSQACGGTILNTRSILTAAHCVEGDAPARWRARLGSSYANSGGSVYDVGSIISHSGYVSQTKDNDLAIMRTASTIVYSSLVKQGSIAGSNYYLRDNKAVWAVGWGTTTQDGSSSEVLRHTVLWTVNQNVCNQRYNEVGRYITNGMLCSGWLDVGGRDQCQGDSGSPLFDNKVVVGVCSWGYGCAQARYPGINARVSYFTSWIQANA